MRGRTNGGGDISSSGGRDRRQWKGERAARETRRDAPNITIGNHVQSLTVVGMRARSIRGERTLELTHPRPYLDTFHSVLVTKLELL